MVCSAACPAPRPHWHRIFLSRFLPATIARAEYVFRRLHHQFWRCRPDDSRTHSLPSSLSFVAAN